MKRLFPILIAALAVGCHAQVPPVITHTCPAATGTSYVALNASSATTALTYNDKPGAMNACYIVQAKDPASLAVSVPSNVVQLTPTAVQSVTLTWTVSPNCAACVYIVSRAPETAYQPTAPVLGTSTVASSKAEIQLVASLSPSQR